jgi:hypothetical protein
MGFSRWRELSPFQYVKGGRSLVRVYGLGDGRVIRVIA